MPKFSKLDAIPAMPKAGPREAEAWSWLTEKVEVHFAGGHLADVAKADKG
ncbi:MAG: hypothetical protein WBC86_02370 [Pseudolabrys sp.]